MKLFLIGAGKLALGLFLAAVAVAAALFGYERVQEAQAERRAKPFEQPMSWDSDVTDRLEMKLSARTKVVGGKFYVAVRMEGSPAFLTRDDLRLRNRDAKVLLHFMDEDGFRVLEHSIALGSFTRIVGDNGTPVGLDYQGEQALVSLDDYARLARLEVAWTIQTDSPAPKTGATPSQAAVLDHCATGISRKERLSRLSARGPLRQDGENSFMVGHEHALMFSYDGSLLLCR